MNIPSFRADGALPNFVAGDPTNISARSPYSTSMQNLVHRFCTSKDRAMLLLGLNEYRKHLYKGGFLSGLQWIDGSFVEDSESNRGRSPADIDVVTLFHRPIIYQGDNAKWLHDYQMHLHTTFFHSPSMKSAYCCDTYSVDLDATPKQIIRHATYWSGLFSQMRASSAQKGFIEVSLTSDLNEFDATADAIRSRFSV